MKYFKRSLRLLVKLFSVFIVELCYRNIWDLRERCKEKNSDLLKQLYFGYLEHYGAWIGLGATFDSIPIFPHGLFGIFISNSAHVGRNVVIFHQVTIGSNTIKGGVNGAPTIGDNVYIGCGAKLIGNIKIGNNARIGANCIVVKDVPTNCVAVTKGTVLIQKNVELDNTFVANNYTACKDE